MTEYSLHELGNNHKVLSHFIVLAYLFSPIPSLSALPRQILPLLIHSFSSFHSLQYLLFSFCFLLPISHGVHHCSFSPRTEAIVLCGSVTHVVGHYRQQMGLEQPSSVAQGGTLLLLLLRRPQPPASSHPPLGPQIGSDILFCHRAII